MDSQTLEDAARGQPGPIPVSGAPGRDIRRVLLPAAGWLLLAWVVLLHGLGSFGLTGPDEPRYAAVAAEMAARGDYITPRLGGVVWLEKPPLYYWLSAASQRLFGLGAVGARLPSALLAALTAILLGLFLRRHRLPAAGMLGAFMAVTAAFWVGFGRAASTDMSLAATLAVALMALYLWAREGPRLWWLLAGVSLGLAVLAKGPVALVLAGAVWLLFLFWTGNARPLRQFPYLLGAAAALLLVAGRWYLTVAIRNPDFFREFFIEQNLQRFATNRYQHPQPFWYYVPIAVLAAAPWTLWLFAPAVRALRALPLRTWGRTRPLELFLALWALVPIVFFSLSHSKLPGYILPSVPPLVGLAAIAIAPRWHLGRGLRIAVASLIVAIAVVVAAATSSPLDRRLDQRFSARPLARALASECGSPPVQLADFARPPAPLLCRGVPVYQWRLNRSLDFGLNYYLHATLPAWNASIATPARILVDGAAVPAFPARGARLLVSGHGWAELALP